MNIKGTIYFFLFIIFIAFSGVYQGHLSQTINPIIFLFFSSSFAFLVFSISCFKQNRFEYIKKALHHKKLLILLNMANVLVWFCYMFAIKYLEPAIGVIIANASGPILVIITSKILRPHIQIFRIEKIAALGISLSLIFIIYNTLIGKSAINIKDNTNILWGLILAIGAGVGQVLFNIFSKKLSENKFSPSEILAGRFFLVLILSFILMDKNIFHQIIYNSSLTVNILFLSLFGMIIPVYFYQKGVKLIEPIYIAVLYILEPVIMFIGQVFDPRLKISLFSYAGVGLICLFSILSIIGRYYGTKKPGSPVIMYKSL